MILDSGLLFLGHPYADLRLYVLNIGFWFRMDYTNTARCTRHCGPDTFIIRSYVLIPTSFLFSLNCYRHETLPCSFRSTPSVDSFKAAVHRLSGVTNSHHWAMPLDPAVKGCTPMAGYPLKNWRVLLQTFNEKTFTVSIIVFEKGIILQTKQ